MLTKLRELLASTAGKWVTAVLAAGLIGFAALQIYGFFQGDTPRQIFWSSYICTETGKQFWHENKVGETQPIFCGFSGKNTGVRAEACYWTAEGAPKQEPTWVLLNEHLGKKEPTMCPDCGRLVVGRNPPAAEGQKPPPTAAEIPKKTKRSPSDARDDR